MGRTEKPGAEERERRRPGFFSGGTVMPKPGLRWWRLVLHTHGSWLHGDPRGFRSRGHRLHSSGDYKNPPPAGEHEGLHRYQKQNSRPAVRLPREVWPVVGRTMVDKCAKTARRVLAVSVGATHVHLLVELDDDYHEAQAFSGRLKQAGSHAVREVWPGRVWASGGKPIAVADRGHQVAVYHYILDHALVGDWVWDDRMGRQG